MINVTATITIELKNVAGETPAQAEENVMKVIESTYVATLAKRLSGTTDSTYSAKVEAKEAQ